MLLTELVRTSEAVAAVPGRSAKIELIAGLLRGAEPGEVPAVVAFLSGDLLQRQIGVGYATLSELPGGGSTGPPITVTEVDALFAAVGSVTGPGSQARRRDMLGGLVARAGQGERAFLIRLLAGELHQGAQEGVMAEAVARAAGVPAAAVRRAQMLGGSLPAVAAAALGGSADPAGALRAFGLRVGRPLRPMLAASAPDVGTALGRISPAAVEWKIDGVRIQVHKDGSDVAVFSRTLDDITGRVPEITGAVQALSATALVLDGEAIALRPDGRPRPFQVTASRTGSQAGGGQQAQALLTPFFFDLLHLDGTDLIDTPAAGRHAAMAGMLPPALLVPRTVTADVAEAGSFFAGAVASGHEGVVVKSTTAAYAAGRRGGDWIKVKPRHTLDLVVLAAEWGHGRRRGWLSNLHLGARDPATGGLVMLGKTFKGLTDQMLTWQTARLLELADPADARPPGGPREAYGVLRVRPALVVEVAFNGVQFSSRYPGGLALRFARVIRYRPDKAAADADTIDAVRALWAQAGGEEAAPPPPG